MRIYAEHFTTAELAAAIRRVMAEVNGLLRTGADQAEIDAELEILRPLAAEYLRRERVAGYFQFRPVFSNSNTLDGWS